ncbi:TPA: M48 family peptidase, partial [Vibrio parahaemolyticus]|nr:M48 family peptidase [Vibrio parahaemolyticus]
MTSVNHKEGNIEEYSFIYGDEAVTYEVIRKVFAEGKKKK